MWRNQYNKIAKCTKRSLLSDSNITESFFKLIISLNIYFEAIYEELSGRAEIADLPEDYIERSTEILKIALDSAEFSFFRYCLAKNPG